MRDRTDSRAARVAAGVVVVAAVLGVLLLVSGVRGVLPSAAVTVAAAAVMWSPFVALLLFLIAQRLPDARRAVPIGPGVNDGWFFALLLSCPLFYFWHHLDAFARRPFGWGDEAALILEATFLGFTLLRAWQVRGTAQGAQIREG